MTTSARPFTGLLFLLLASSLFGQNFNFQLRSKLAFPGQTLANVFGYSQNGREYALVGASKGLVVVDVTDPEQPLQIIQIPGPDNLWKEVKTYGHYCYVTTEGGSGLQVIDLQNLPADNLSWKNYTGDGDIAGLLNTIHALHVDTTLGFVYLYGTNLFSGGAIVLDIHTDPYNPRYVGKFDQLGYVHDGYANNDTLYGSHIYAGVLSIVDMRDKANPLLLGTIQTPGSFTHNSWRLVDKTTILTTDEATPSFVAAYNIEDPDDIRELDRLSTNDGNGSIGHNTHIRDNWAVTSWYTDGVTIADAHKPDNLVFTGWYDTWNGEGPDFEGCWGTYPLFASGTVLATNISPGELFVLTPTYVRACYLEGSVIDGCSGLPLSEVAVDVNSSDRWIDTETTPNGVFKTGQAAEGTFEVTFSKAGYLSRTITVDLRAGDVAERTIQLEPLSAFNLSGTVVDKRTQAPIPNVQIIAAGTDVTYNTQSNSKGEFAVNCALGGGYTIITGTWGYLPASLDLDNDDPVTIELDNGYYDDFGLNLGWTTAFTASSGLWVRAEPLGTFNQNEAANPDNDVQLDGNDRCFVTGNGGGQAGTDDVDNGTVTLSTPSMTLADYKDATLSFWYWFYNAGGNNDPNDSLLVAATNGTDTAAVFSQPVSAGNWRFSGQIKLAGLLPLTNNVRIHFITGDAQTSGHLVEAAVDYFVVEPGELIASSVLNPADESSVRVWPNPGPGRFNVQLAGGTRNARLMVFNALGQCVWEQHSPSEFTTIDLGDDCPAGLYWLGVQESGRLKEVLRLVVKE